MFLKQAPSCLVCQGLKTFKAWGYGDEQAYEAECLESRLGTAHTLMLHRRHTLSADFRVGVDEWLAYWKKEYKRWDGLITIDARRDAKALANRVSRSPSADGKLSTKG